MNQFWEALKGTISRMTLVQRVVVGVLVAVPFLFLVWAYMTGPDMTTLYTNLDVQELGRVKQQLDASGVQYEIDGTTVKIASTNFNETRLNLLVADSSLASGMGWELFDSADLDMSPNTQRIKETRAIQGELERTIRTLEPVQKARVHITIPESSPFIRDPGAVTASVMVTPRSGAMLSKRQVDGIVAFVSGSVPKLQSEDVTVVDNQSRLLSKRPEDPDSAVSGDQLAYQREVEAALERKAQSLLDRVLGHGQSEVRVAAEFDFRQIKEMSHTVEPESRVQVYENLSDSTSEEQQPGGVAGAAPNLAPVVPAATSGNGGSSAEQMIETKWEPSKVVREFEQKRNAIERLTVSVILVPQDPDATDEEEALGMTRVEAQDLVKNAVGFKGGRDSITVTVGSPKVVVAVPDVAVRWYQSSGFWYPAAAFLGAVGFLLIAVSVARSIKSQREAQASAAAALAGEDLRNLETMAEALRVWVDDE